uniref:Chitin-binding type-2 domain-containing protein n=2 Tax=Clytia hemisphaerica TaxID=252671 RepID=A0A7M5XDF4_9CNID
QLVQLQSKLKNHFSQSIIMKAFIILSIIAASYALEVGTQTGTTPPAVACPNSLCQGKPDGNFEYYYYGDYNPHYFVQCSNGLAYCQACWPLSLEFSEGCNQCLYSKYDECVTTQPWEPATTFYCPDKCPHYGPEFSGNVEDPNNPHQYVACWKGVTVGCIACPAGLLFNQKWNACLYEGKYKTEPESKNPYTEHY